MHRLSLYCGCQASPFQLSELEIRKARQSGRYAESGVQERQVCVVLIRLRLRSLMVAILI